MTLGGCELREFATYVPAGWLLPAVPRRREVEQRRLGQQVPEYGGAAGGEVGIGDMRVLRPDASNVRCVPLLAGGQDRQVRVTQDHPGAVVVGRAVRPGEPDQSRDLGRQFWRQSAELLLG